MGNLAFLFGGSESGRKVNSAVGRGKLPRENSFFKKAGNSLDGFIVLPIESQEISLKVFISFILFWVSLLSAGCQANTVDRETPLEPIPSLFTETVSPTGEPQMTPSLPSSGHSGLQNLVDKAMADLAQRLAVSVDEVVLLDATGVTWPDSSLGCPQEGMVYSQVLTPGYLIRLRSGDQEFEYHASRGTEVVYCENPMPPVEGTPGDV